MSNSKLIFYKSRSEIFFYLWYYISDAQIFDREHSGLAAIILSGTGQGIFKLAVCLPNERSF